MFSSIYIQKTFKTFVFEQSSFEYFDICSKNPFVISFNSLFSIKKTT